VKTNRADTKRRRPGIAGAVLAAVTALASGAATAATFPELYTVTVDSAQACGIGDAARRTQVARLGLPKLLTRITGGSEAAGDPEILQRLLSNTQALVTSCSNEQGGRMQIGFNPATVTGVLTDLGWPIWSEDRPATLLWIAADLGGGERAELMAAEGDPARRVRAIAGVAGAASNPLPPAAEAAFDGVVAELLLAADDRGLPLVLPRLDAEDRQHVRFADVWGGFDRFVARAAERYDVDAVLIGRVDLTAASPAVDWILLRGERRQARPGSSLRAGIDWLADQFASEYRIVGDARLSWITVRRIETFSDQMRVEEYLNSVRVFESVELEESSDGEYLWRVIFRGDDAQIRQILGLGGVLVPPGAPRGQRGQRGLPGPPGPLTADEDEGRMVFVPAWRADPDSPGLP